jgi:hypothetical protein
MESNVDAAMASADSQQSYSQSFVQQAKGLVTTSGNSIVTTISKLDQIPDQVRGVGERTAACLPADGKVRFRLWTQFFLF